MSKQEFLQRLRRELSALPQDDVEERLTFYSEMIDDRMEEGITEEEAVAGIGSVEEVASQILADIPRAKLVKERSKPKRRLGVWEVILLILGSPIWLSLLLAAAAVIFSAYVALWSLIAALWAAEVALWASTLGGVACGIGLACGSNSLAGIAVIGAGIALAGLSIFLFFAFQAATAGIWKLTKKIARLIKNSFVKKEGTV